jgi:hypothetical protein
VDKKEKENTKGMRAMENIRKTREQQENHIYTNPAKISHDTQG